MSHISSKIIHDSLIDLFTDEQEYPGVREHFTSEELGKVEAMANQTTFTTLDKMFLIYMASKAIWLAE